MSPKEFHEWMYTAEPEKHKYEYGHCPHCDEPCQPDYAWSDNYDEEWVECDACGITWALWHDDPTDKRDETEPWRKYRISDIELT